MITTIAKFYPDLPGFSWLTGPIFEKELRVSSRRRRNYFLRFIYLALLTIFITFAWTITVKIGSSASRVYQISRMAEAGKHITATIVSFQFITAQLIAAVMLSTAISDEIYHRTLGVLMTTPISSFQIVIGKLLSKLLQLVLLLAISLPILAIIRIFGGVPWDYVLSSLCITLTAAIFTGAISFLFSIYNRQAYMVTLRTCLVCFLFYIIPPVILQLLQFTRQVSIVPVSALFYINPFIAIQSVTANMLSPFSMALTQSWRLHCVIMLGLSTLLLTLSTMCVRAVGRHQVTGQAGIFSTRKERRLAKAKRKKNADSTATSRKIRRVMGPPIIWKEMISPLIKTSRLRATLRVAVAFMILVCIYGYYAYTNLFNLNGTHLGFILAYFFLGLFRVSTSAATSITTEKEARTWPILLTTPPAGKQIAIGKIIGSCLQGWLFWLLLAAHVVVFSLARCIPPAAILPLALLVVSSALLISAVGVFFSSCFKRSSASASINMILFLTFTVPVCCSPVFIASPLFVATMILAVTGGWSETSAPFQQVGAGWAWLGAFWTSGLKLFILVVTYSLLYLSLAIAAFTIATRNIRRRIF